MNLFIMTFSSFVIFIFLRGQMQFLRVVKTTFLLCFRSSVWELLCFGGSCSVYLLHFDSLFNASSSVVGRLLTSRERMWKRYLKVHPLQRAHIFHLFPFYAEKTGLKFSVHIFVVIAIFRLHFKELFGLTIFILLLICIF